jgi:site-specific DNA-methyltransferase (adenine-specific)
MTPYYEHGGVAIHHCDCRELTIAADMVLTDPPYGINYRSNHNTSRRGEWAKWVRDENFDGIANDDGSLNLSWLLGYPTVAICGGNYYALPPTRCWITWDKRDGIGPNDQADSELVWTNLQKPSRIYRHLWSGLLRAGEENIARSGKLHPHQKPVGLGVFILGYAERPATVYDPFMGSGSFIVAAKRMGLRAVGCDVDERNCETAAKRLAQEALPLEVA